jgi:hypothetical protein
VRQGWIKSYVLEFGQKIKGRLESSILIVPCRRVGDSCAGLGRTKAVGGKAECSQKGIQVWKPELISVTEKAPSVGSSCLFLGETQHE